MPTVKPQPDGYHAVTPYLICDDAAAAIAFYKKAFGAKELMPPMPAPGGKIGHAELRIGDSAIMLADAAAGEELRGPRSLGGTALMLLLYVPDVDETVRTAVDAGAKIVQEVKNQFYGDRSGTIEDPAGHVWTIATHVEDVPPDEMERRVKAMQTGG